MGLLSYGPVTRHINASRGPDTESTHFYVTEYSLSHGKPNFQARPGKHTGTGYKSNFRPGLYYSRRLDEIDNPQLGDSLKDNYSTLNSFDFQQPVGSKGTDVFPEQLHMVKNAFVKDRPQTLPKEKQVLTACFDPSYGNFAKPPRSLLYQRCTKDPIEMENENRGPARMSTENQVRFHTHPIYAMQDISEKSVGPKEGSGFTHAYNNEPITFRDDQCYKVDSPDDRPLGTTHMKSSFRPTQYANGKEPCRLLSQRAADQNGYTRTIKARPEYARHRHETYTKLEDIHPSRQKYIKKNDTGEYFNLTHGSQFPSMTASVFKGDQTTDEAPGKPTWRRSMGNKEDTGFTENNYKFIPAAETKQTLKRFDTHYKLRFYDKNPKAFRGNTKQPIPTALRQKENGFVKSTRVHSLGKQIDIRDKIGSLDTYVSRSMVAQDPTCVMR